MTVARRPDPDAASARPEVLADLVHDRLRARADAARAVEERRYLRSRAEHLGVSVPVIRSVAMDLHRTHPGLDHDAVMALVLDLWERGVHECRMAAVELLALHKGQLDEDDLPLLERLLREAGTWALVDGLAASVIGSVLEAHPAAAATVDRWSFDEDDWVRRASLLAHLPALRTGRGDFDRFAAAADRMIEDRNPFIRKAIGWVLREAGRTRPDQVVSWLGPRLHVASGVTVREAVKRLPEADRLRLLAARRATTGASRSR